ncbi:hypothetical protein, partial [Achromobacter xylosoxidans]|uniref:hypothetical protein n=1 Tax=Alcaligenes xylosoxydans xylosoxydans TaxID=85698 RepID=UPI001F0E1EB6
FLPPGAAALVDDPGYYPLFGKLKLAGVRMLGVPRLADGPDLAMRWGFGWAQGPFETWQAAGWQAIARAVAEDIAAGRAMSD